MITTRQHTNRSPTILEHENMTSQLSLNGGDPTQTRALSYVSIAIQRGILWLFVCSFQAPSVHHLCRSSLSIPPWFPSPPPPPSHPPSLFVSLCLFVSGLTSRSQWSPMMVTSPDSAAGSPIHAPALPHFTLSGCSLCILHPSLSFNPVLHTTLRGHRPPDASPPPTHRP